MGVVNDNFVDLSTSLSMMILFELATCDLAFALRCDKSGELDPCNFRCEITHTKKFLVGSLIRVYRVQLESKGLLALTLLISHNTRRWSGFESLHNGDGGVVRSWWLNTTPNTQTILFNSFQNLVCALYSRCEPYSFVDFAFWV